MKARWIPTLAALVVLRSTFAAIGCTLSNPAQDLKYLFPEMTSFKEENKELNKMKDGQKLFQNLKERLGSDLDPVYETYDTPYTVYTVFKGEEVIGIVHGVNVPGKGGVIQVFLHTDPKTAEIKNFFFQRLESPAAKALKNKEFRAKFTELTLADFYKHDYYKVADPKTEKDKVAKIESPVQDEKARPDFDATIRGIRKNLILLDMFVYELKSEPYYERSKEALAKKKSGQGDPDKPKNAPADAKEKK
jgi:hypothetical protein